MYATIMPFFVVLIVGHIRNGNGDSHSSERGSSNRRVQPPNEKHNLTIMTHFATMRGSSKPITTIIDKVRKGWLIGGGLQHQDVITIRTLGYQLHHTRGVLIKQDHLARQLCKFLSFPPTHTSEQSCLQSTVSRCQHQRSERSSLAPLTLHTQSEHSKPLEATLSPRIGRAHTPKSTPRSGPRVATNMTFTHHLPCRGWRNET